MMRATCLDQAALAACVWRSEALEAAGRRRGLCGGVYGSEDEVFESGGFAPRICAGFRPESLGAKQDRVVNASRRKSQPLLVTMLDVCVGPCNFEVG